MADTSTSITNFPDSGSAERVAYDMFKYLRSYASDPAGKPGTKDAMLDLYAECLHATHGFRNPGKTYGGSA